MGCHGRLVGRERLCHAHRGRGSAGKSDEVLRWDRVPGQEVASNDHPNLCRPRLARSIRHVQEAVDNGIFQLQPSTDQTRARQLVVAASTANGRGPSTAQSWARVSNRTSTYPPLQQMDPIEGLSSKAHEPRNSCLAFRPEDGATAFLAWRLDVTDGRLDLDPAQQLRGGLVQKFDVSSSTGRQTQARAREIPRHTVIETVFSPCGSIIRESNNDRSNKDTRSYGER